MRLQLLPIVLLLDCTSQRTVSTPAAPAAPEPATPSSPKPAAASSSTPTATSEPKPTPDELCRAEGFDFAYPFPYHEGYPHLGCGKGPGTLCRAGAGGCDGPRIRYCLYKRLTEADCHELCTQRGDMNGVTYDHGYCEAVNTKEPSCKCCDAGEPGCEHIKPKPRQPSVVVPLAPPAGRDQAGLRTAPSPPPRSPP